tara:strand:+ start:293 stop:1543 length:1251 start_codon:yes stop_codon:yes gene_type:complete
MTKTFKGGIVGGFDQLKAPDAPSITATGTSTQITVTFTNPSDVGGSAITSFTATAQDPTAGTLTGVTSSSSPVTITGLTTGTDYSVTGLVTNSFGSSPYSLSVSPTLFSDVGVFMGGFNSNNIAITQDKVTIATDGNATDFGDSTVAMGGISGGGASAVRGIFNTGSLSLYSNALLYITFASLSSAVDFGDLNYTSQSGAASLSNSTRMCIATGSVNPGGAARTEVDYVTIATLGDASDFGDLSVARYQTGACASGTRGLFFGGRDNSTYTESDVIDYREIASLGTFIDFGNLSEKRYQVAATCSSTRALACGGIEGSQGADGKVNFIEYITIASLSNTIDFGDLSRTKTACMANNNNTKAIIGGGTGDGGLSSDGYIVEIDKVTITTLSNTSDFGDLSEGRFQGGSQSSNHGGLH